MVKRLLGFYIFFQLICSWVQLNAEPLKIDSIMECYFGKDKFTRISEHFTGVEDTGGDTILRTEASCRSGIYLVININKKIRALGSGSFLNLKYILSNSNLEKEITFSLDSSCGKSSWIFVGITGSAFCGADRLIAWSLEIRSPEDCVVQSSYLWRMEHFKE